MSFIEKIKDAFNIILHPSQAKRKENITDVLAFYFAVSIIPTILLIVADSIFAFNPFLLPLFIISAIIFYAVIPLGVFIDSGIYYLIIKKLFNLYNGDFKDTYTAFIYATLPYILFYWLTVFPVIGGMFFLVILLWDFVIAIVVLSKMFKMSKLKAFGTLLLDFVVVFAIIFLILSVLLSMAILPAFI